MSFRKQKPTVDPVIIVATGVLFVAIALILAVFNPQSTSVNGSADAGSISQLAVAFITGLTTGGLSCLAVQGGLLASSLAHQIEQDYLAQVQHRKPRKKVQQQQRSSTA